MLASKHTRTHALNKPFPGVPIGWFPFYLPDKGEVSGVGKILQTEINKEQGNDGE